MTTDNNNILDTILDEHMPIRVPVALVAPVVQPQPVFNGGGHSFARGAQITSSGVAIAGMGLAASAYRGYGKDVSGCGNDPVAVRQVGGLDWNVARRPIKIVGNREDRLWDGMVALVRSDTGKPLAPASAGYKVHQNELLVGTMCKFADAAGLNLSRIGLFDGGTSGFAVATSGVRREAKVGDVVSLDIVLRFGHQPGFATRFAAWARELRCSNGATVTVAGGRAKFTHGGELTEGKIQDAMEYVLAATQAFDNHVQLLANLRKAQSNTAVDLLQLAQVFQPELAQSICHRVTPDQDVMGKKVITAILDRESDQRIVAAMVNEHKARLLNAVIEATMSQPGGEMTYGTAAHAYSGVTHFNSNVRGRSAETGLNAHLFGDSGKASQEALKVAVQVMAATN